MEGRMELHFKLASVKTINIDNMEWRCKGKNRMKPSRQFYTLRWIGYPIGKIAQAILKMNITFT